MSKQLTDKELEALFQKYLPTDEMPAVMAQRIENQVLYEVGLSLRSERGGAAASTRGQSWIDRLFNSIPKLRIGPSLALASASAVAVLLLFTYGADLIKRLNDADVTSGTGNIGVVQDTPTPDIAEGTVETVPTEDTTSIAEAVNTDTPTPTETSEPAPEETASPSPTGEANQGESDDGTNEAVAPDSTVPDSADAPVSGGDAPVVDAPAEVETATVGETVAPTSALQESGTETDVADPTPIPEKTSAKTGNISPVTAPTTVATASSGGSTPGTPTASIPITSTPAALGTARATSTPTASVQAVAQLNPTATPVPTNSVEASPSPQQPNATVTTATPTNTPTKAAQITVTSGGTSNPGQTPNATPAPSATVTETPTPIVITTDTPKLTVTPSATHTPNAASPITTTPEATSTKIALVGNQPPVTAPDSAIVSEEQTIRVSVLNNDSDPEGDSLTLVSVGAARNGTTTVTGSQVRYVPEKDYHGEDSFTYTVSDGRAESTETVRLTVRPVNDIPVANDDSIDVNEDIVARFDALANDTDVDQDALSIRSFGQPAHGIVAVEDNIFVYKPTLNYNGADRFSYVLTDGSAEVTAHITIQVAAVNDAPNAILDSATVAEDQSVSVAVLENDRDVEESTLTIASTTSPRSGSASVSADGLTILYTPASDFNGSDEFGYTVTDGVLSSTGTVRISVDAVNDAPIAIEDIRGTGEDTPIAIDVGANDRDIDGDTLSVTSFGQGENGAVTVTGEGLLYTPTKDFSGSDRFEYTISDGVASSSAFVIVNISSENDSPLARGDDRTVAEDGAIVIAVLDNDSDPEGEPLSITQVSTAQNGTATLEGTTIRYAPKPNYNGDDQFTYTLSDGVHSAVATVSLTVTAVNDPPEVFGESVNLNEDSEVSILPLANDSDADGDALTLAVAVQPTHGVVTVNGTNVIYKPALHYNGADAFEYIVSDGVESRSAKVTLTVVAVNDPPVALGDSINVSEDGEGSVSPLANDSDADGDTLTIASVGQAAHGTVTVNGTNVVYKPAPDYNGTDAFEYTVSDGIETRSANVMITVLAVNDPPTAAPDAATTAEDAPVTIPILANDVDVDSTLQVTIVSGPTHGTVTVVGSDIRYQPEQDFAGQDGFTYQIKESNGEGTAQTSVTITVAPVNDSPVADDDSGSTNMNEAVVIEVLSNDGDVDSAQEDLTITIVNQPANGSAVISKTLIIYTPNSGYYTPASGQPDRFVYRLSDGSASDDATISVTVINRAPSTSNDSAVADANRAVQIGVLENDSDPDGLALTIANVGAAGNGTVRVEGNVVVYTPNPGFTGSDSFTYLSSDGVNQAEATVTVEVRNSAPEAQDDAATTIQGQAVVINPLTNDTDLNGDSLTIIGLGEAANGAIVMNGSVITYTPSADFANGIDSFTYTISDGINTNTATVNVTVNAQSAP